MASGPSTRTLTIGAVALLVAATGCGTVSHPPRPQHPEAWPPTNATECLRTRSSVEWFQHWPLAVAVRDWRQPVRDGRVDVVLCGLVSGASSPPADPMVFTVHGTGGVRVPPATGVQWSGVEGLVAPVTAEASGPGSLTVEMSSPAVAPVGATRSLTVYVVAEDGGLVVSECPDDESCRWDRRGDRLSGGRAR